MKLFAAVVVIAAIGVLLPVEARQAAPQATPVFRGGVQLVRLNVSVQDQSGRPVEDLGVGDFEVKLNGEVQAVRTAMFYRTAPGGPPVGTAAVQTGRERSNLGATPAPANVVSRTVLLLIDDLSYQFVSTDLMSLRAGFSRVLDQFGPSDRVGVATTSGTTREVAPTTDRAAVRSVLNEIVGRFDQSVPDDVYLTLDEAYQIAALSGDPRDAGSPAHRMLSVYDRECSLSNIPWDMCPGVLRHHARLFLNDAVQRASLQVRALLEVADAMKRLPGPRTLVVLSDGLAAGVGPLSTSDLIRFGPAAAEAGLQVYAVTGARDGSQIAERHFERAQARSQEQARLQDGVENIASVAGGQALRFIGTADSLFERIITQTSGYYELGVELDLSNHKRVLASDVKVRRPGTRVLASKHAIATDIAPEPVSVAADMQNILQTGVSAVGVGLSVATSVRRSSTGRELELGVHAAVPTSVPFPVACRFIVLNDFQQVVSSGELQVTDRGAEEQQQFSFAVGLASGHYALRVAVADASGNIGSLEYPVRARLTPAGGWFASDPQLAWEDEKGARHFLALERLPAAAQAVRLSLEMYAADVAALPSGTVVRVELLSSAGSPLAATDVPAVIRDATAAIGASISVGALGPGLYTFRATVIEDGRSVGELAASFRKLTPASIPTAPSAAPPVPSPSPAAPSASAGPPGARWANAAELLTSLKNEAASNWPTPAISSLLSRAIIQKHIALIASAAREALPATLADRSVSDDGFWAAMKERSEAGTGAVDAFAGAVLALRSGSASSAETTLQRVLAQTRSSMSVVLFIGAANATRDRLGDAAGAWQMGVGDPTAEVEWHLALADALARIGEQGAALDALIEAQKTFPASLEIAARLARHRLARGEFAEAREALGRVAQDGFPRDLELFWWTALAYADVLASRTPATLAAFRSAAERYLQINGTRADVVRWWLARMVAVKAH